MENKKINLTEIIEMGVIDFKKWNNGGTRTLNILDYICMLIVQSKQIRHSVRETNENILKILDKLRSDRIEKVFKTLSLGKTKNVKTNKVNNKKYINNNSTVTDTTTGLMWLRDPQDYSVEPQEWREAINGCGQFGFAGHKDWRLPTVQELFAIVDFTKREFPLIDDVFICPKYWYWTATDYVPSTANAMFVNFTYGSVDINYKTSAYYVRPVRGGWNENKAL